MCCVCVCVRVSICLLCVVSLGVSPVGRDNFDLVELFEMAAATCPTLCGCNSRRRDCHFTDIPYPSLLKRLLKGEGGAAE